MATHWRGVRITLIWLLYLIVAFSEPQTVSTDTDVDELIASFKEEAYSTYQSLLRSYSDESEKGNSNSRRPPMKYEEFEMYYITMSLEEETQKILKSKGLTYDDLNGVISKDDEISNEPLSATKQFISHFNNKPIKKKDAPMTTSGLLEQQRVQSIQAELVKEREKRILETKSIFEFDLKEHDSFLPLSSKSRDILCAPPVYTENWYQPNTQCSPGSSHSNPCKRIIIDGFIDDKDCSMIISSLKGDGEGDGIGMQNLFHQGGSTSLVPGPAIESRIGRKTLALIQSIQQKALAQVEVEHGLQHGSLYPSGSLLSRIMGNPPNDKWELNHTHIYWNAHVDKANVASYDYSVLIYLNTIGIDFKGGLFSFLDDDDVNRQVEPRSGRMLIFSSGFENLHRVHRVTEGTRFVLAMWFTCSPEYSYTKYIEEKMN